MLPNYATSSNVFHHFTKEEQQQYFDLSMRKVVHNIDTLYYSVFLKDELVDNIGINKLVGYLASVKENMQLSSVREMELSEHGFNAIVTGFSIYQYHLSEPELYDVFISSYLPNDETPRIVVQLRSIGLWTVGEKELIFNSSTKLAKFLKSFNIEIDKIQENRIDYAYHTNIIQNTYKYFSDENLLNHLSSSFTKYQKIGDIGKRITVETLNLGNKKSNNIYFRAYNKTIEVVQMNYKAFFFEYWYKSKLISYYDKYCLEHAYIQKSFKSGLCYGRCMFYIEHGSDAQLKERLQAYIKTYKYKSSNIGEWEKKLKGVLPEVTTIMNIEFQTKRKFYQTCNTVDMAVAVPEDNILCNIYRIIDNRKIFLDYLTSQTVSFIDKESENKDYLPWWKAIRSCKMKKSLCDLSLIREYGRNMNLERLKQEIVSKVATASVYMNNTNEHNFSEDIVDLLTNLNDNDIMFMNKHGEINPTIDIKNYKHIKAQKNTKLKALLAKHNK